MRKKNISSLRGVLFALLSVASAAAQKEVSYSPLTDGSASASNYGEAVAGRGDLDGDGTADFAVGAGAANSEDGLVYAYSGATGAPLYGGPLSPSVPATVSGGHYYFGHSINMSRDFNADGRPDIVVGAPQDSGLTDRRGFVNLIDGVTTALIASWAGNPGDLFGSSVSVGDVDGDGNPDVIVGARQGSVGPGYVAAYSGIAPFGQIFLQASPSAANFTLFGSSVAAADVNGDGFSDVIVGADEEGEFPPFGTGFVQVLLGPGGSPAPYPVITGATIGDRFGVAVANAGDIAGDADAFGDILVGATQEHSREGIGYAMVFDGLTGALIDTFQGEQPNDYFGSSVAGNFDFNQDGFVDFLVGARQAQTAGKRGYVRVQSGKPGLGPPFLYRREGDKPSTPNAGSGVGFGRSVDVIGNTEPFTSISLVAGGVIHSGAGHAEVFSGRQLLLTAVPDFVSLGEILSLVATQLPAFSPTALLVGLPPAPTELHPFQGVPILPIPLFISSMQANETWLLSGVAPASLAGVKVLVQVAGKVVGGPILLSDIQSIEF